MVPFTFHMVAKSAGVPSPRVPSPASPLWSPEIKNAQRQSNTHDISLFVLQINTQLHACRSNTFQLNHTKCSQHNWPPQLSDSLSHFY